MGAGQSHIPGKKSGARCLGSWAGGRREEGNLTSQSRAPNPGGVSCVVVRAKVGGWGQAAGCKRGCRR